MDYMNPDVRCPKKAVKFNHSLTTDDFTCCSLVMPYSSLEVWTGSSLVQVMACCLFCAKPLHDPMVTSY